MLRFDSSKFRWRSWRRKFSEIEEIAGRMKLEIENAWKIERQNEISFESLRKKNDEQSVIKWLTGRKWKVAMWNWIAQTANWSLFVWEQSLNLIMVDSGSIRAADEQEVRIKTDASFFSASFEDELKFVQWISSFVWLELSKTRWLNLLNFFCVI
jgi:hypothetical protein